MEETGKGNRRCLFYGTASEIGCKGCEKVSPEKRRHSVPLTLRSPVSR